MPTTAQILESNSAIANGAIWLAVLWHVALLFALREYLLGWRPKRREAGRLLAWPAMSVGMIALAYGSLFNGIVFLGLAVALSLSARKLKGRVRRGSEWQVLVGHIFIGIGLFYPHFADVSPLAYVVAAPFGLLPCPTLLVLVGFTVLAGGFSKAWNLTLVFLATFYGVVGVVQLGVWLDGALVAAALTLSWIAASLMYRAPRMIAT